jgi:hypothetical protein
MITKSVHKQAMRATAATYEFEEAEEMFDNPWLHNCDCMVDIIASKNMSWPKKSANNNN